MPNMPPPAISISRWPRHLGIALILLAVLFGLNRWRGERVEVSRAEQGDLRQSIVASGRVRTPQRLEITSQITSRIVAVDVKEGEKMTAGQTLLRLDERELRAARDQAAAALEQSEAKLRQLGELGRPVADQNLNQSRANLAQAQKQFERVSELVRKGFYSSAQLDDARRSLTVTESQARAAELQLASNQPGGSEAALAKSAIAQARAALAVAEARLAYATLKAPVDGTVLSRNAEVGDTAQPGKTLLAIAPQTDTELTAQIDEKNIALLRVGQHALASADAYPGEHFPAEISYIAPAVDAQRGSVEIRLRVAEPPAYLKHEMTVSIDIAAAQGNAVILVPADTLRDAGLAPWIMVVRDGKTVRQPVSLGLRGSGKVEIRSGVVAGEAILPASATIAEGKRVTTTAGATAVATTMEATAGPGINR